ncbi:hypothetical protein HDV01_002000 [Terramyces sp. JEL0728]|nr:hypothetical protein HDV01_002000 [Terramyces sp. JEL0728]
MFDLVQAEIPFIAQHLTIVDYIKWKLSIKIQFQSLPMLNPAPFFEGIDCSNKLSSHKIIDFSRYCKLNTEFITEWNILAIKLVESNLICEIGRTSMEKLDFVTKAELLMYKLGDELSTRILKSIDTSKMDNSLLKPVFINLWFQYCRYGYLGSLKYLIEIANYPQGLYELGLETVVVFGHYSITKYFLEVLNTDPSSNENVAIKRSSENGHARIVELLLSDERVNPYVCRSFSLRRAAINGHFEVVKLLLQQPRMRGRGVRVALRYAKEHGFKEIAKILEQKLDEQSQIQK